MTAVMTWNHGIMTAGDDRKARAPAEPVSLDHAVLDTLRGLGRPGSGGALPRLVPLFLATAESQVAALHAALATADIAALHATAHTMKSSCGSIGAARLARLCETLESCSDPRRGAPPAGAELRELVGRIEREFSVAAQALRAVLAARG